MVKARVAPHGNEYSLKVVYAVRLFHLATGARFLLFIAMLQKWRVSKWTYQVHS